MGLPQNNPDGYMNASVSSVEGFRHVDFLLAHGTSFLPLCSLVPLPMLPQDLETTMFTSPTPLTYWTCLPMPKSDGSGSACSQTGVSIYYYARFYP
jgi:hypothetical protein